MGWQQELRLHGLAVQQAPDAHWSLLLQKAPKLPVPPEEELLPVEAALLLPELLELLETVELWPDELVLLLLEELAALVATELALVPEELPLPMLALLPVELELDEVALLRLVEELVEVEALDVELLVVVGQATLVG